MKHFDKLFEEMTKSLVNETSKAHTDVISEQIDAFEKRMSKMIDDKLSSLGQNNTERGEVEINELTPDSTGDSTETETQAQTETQNDTAN